MKIQNLINGIIVLHCIFGVLNALPIPQDDEPAGGPEDAFQPPAGDPPGFISAISGDDTNPENGNNPLTPAPISEDTRNGEPTETSPIGVKSPRNSSGDECGASCILANQTPIILLIVILVLVILLLIILFGCYFMKKLHGKAIFTTGQRHHTIINNEKDIEYLKGGETVEKKTFETLVPTASGETKKVITTTTTKVTTSSSNTGEALMDIPFRT